MSVADKLIEIKKPPENLFISARETSTNSSVRHCFQQRTYWSEWYLVIRQESPGKALTDNQYERSVEAKEIRLAATFENQHLEQCNSLPIDGFDTARHGVHLNPCYKKFTKSPDKVNLGPSA